MPASDDPTSIMPIATLAVSMRRMAPGRCRPQRRNDPAAPVDLDLRGTVAATDLHVEAT
jgi:hypothetical protein